MISTFINIFKKGFPGDSVVKNPLTMQERGIQSLGWEDPLEKEMATHSSVLARKIPWTEEPDWLRSMDHRELDRTKATKHNHNYKDNSI